VIMRFLPPSTWQIWAPSIQTPPHQIWGSNLFNKGRMMKSYQAKTLTMHNQVQLIQEQGPEWIRWLTFCKKTKQHETAARKCPVLCTWFLRLHCGLSLIFLYFWDPHDVNFHVQALISNHAHKRMGDQVVFLNRSDWLQFCMVRWFSPITMFERAITLISFLGGLVHTLRFYLMA